MAHKTPGQRPSRLLTFFLGHTLPPVSSQTAAPLIAGTLARQALTDATRGGRIPVVFKTNAWSFILVGAVLSSAATALAVAASANDALLYVGAAFFGPIGLALTLIGAIRGGLAHTRS